MTVESVSWFSAQLAVGIMLFVLGRLVVRARPPVWKTVATGATVVALAWPLMRWYPGWFLDLLGARVLMYIEVTGMIPSVILLFTIAAAQVRRMPQRRLSVLLVLVCGLYFVRSGLWMVREPIPDLGKTRINQGVCMQSTHYTCVAASLVTLLYAYGIEATETEMARLCYTEVDRGATDTRAISALEKKLDGREYEICYEMMDYDRLRQVHLPCLVSTDFAFFISHMTPVLSAGDEEVVLGDPLTGRRALSTADFKDVWQGRGIYLRRSGVVRGDGLGEQSEFYHSPGFFWGDVSSF